MNFSNFSVSEQLSMNNFSSSGNHNNASSQQENFTIFNRTFHILRDDWGPRKMFGGIVLPTMSFLTLISNIYVICIFARKKLRSASTVLLIGLAASDSLCGLLATGFFPYIYIHRDANYMTYPFCLIYKISRAVSWIFHYSSAFITSCLAIQKFVVVRFPFRGPQHCTIKTSYLLIFVVLLINIMLVVPSTVIQHTKIKSIRPLSSIEITDRNESFSYPENICIYVEHDYNYIFQNLNLWTSFVLTLVSFCLCCLMTIITIYLIVKAYKNKMTRVQINSSKRQRAKQRSMIIIVIILVLFLITEFPATLAGMCYMVYLSSHTQLDSVCADMTQSLNDTFENFYLFYYICFQVGAMCNMWVYISLSQDFRSAFLASFRCRHQ